MDMKHYLCLMICCLTLTFSAIGRSERDTLGAGTEVRFVENKGQWDGDYYFQAQLHDAALFLEDSSVTVALRSRSIHPARDLGQVSYHAYRMTFAGSNASSPFGNMADKETSNYFLGNNPARWRTAVASYAKVVYDGLYEGVDLELTGDKRALKYNFVVHPDGNPTHIKIVYEGTDGVEVGRDGELRIRTTVRDVVELKPYVYQEYRGGKVEVLSRWRVHRMGEGRYCATIEVDAYDHNRDLVIDPTLIFSTYTGSVADNWGTTATYDAQKNVYTAGLVFGLNYPVSLGAYQTVFGGAIDVGIFKFDSTGSQRCYATYLGGSSVDMPHSMIVNSFDELVIFGTTGSSDFPVTATAYQSSFGGGPLINYLSPSMSFEDGSDIFVSRLSSSGDELKASTYVGGSGNDGLNYKQHFNNSYQTIMDGNDSLYRNYGDGARGEIITDQLNNIYIGSTTFSTDFPVSEGAVQTTNGGKQDGVVFKLDHNLHTLLWSTYLGGSKDDAVYSVDVDHDYNLLVCGGTSSSDFPVTEGVYQSYYGGGSADGFVSKISYYGDKLMASGYYGAQYYDQLYFVRSGPKDDVFLFGQTHPNGSTMIYNAAYSVNNSGMLLVRMSPTFDTLRWSTVFGTPGRINLSPTAFGVDICDRVYAAGWGRDFVGYNGVTWYTKGTSGMETTSDAYQDTTDGQDFYIMSLASDASTLEFASFFGELHGGSGTSRGSDHVDGGTSRFDRQSTLYQSVCASCGGDNGFPITDSAWSSQNKSTNCNNGLFRFNVHDGYPVADFTMPMGGCAPYTVTFENTGRGTSFEWDFGDDSTSTETSPQHTYTSAGNYTVTLVAKMEGGCKTSDTITHLVQVLGSESFTHTPEIACNGSMIQIGPQPALGVTYHWTGDSVSDPNVANPWVSKTGNYVLQSTVSGGCTQTDTFHVKGYTLVDQQGITAISCHDSSDGKALFRLGTEMDPDSVSVYVVPSCTVSAPVKVGDRWFFSLDNLSANVVYHLTVSGYGCEYTTDVKLENPPLPYYEKETDAVLCSDSCTGRIHIRYNMSAIPEVQPLDTLITGLCEGVYVTNLISLGCPLSDTTIVSRDHSLDSLKAVADQSIVAMGESTTVHAVGVTMPATYIWTPSATVENPTARDAVVTPDDTLTCYTVTATSQSGCKASDSVCIRCFEVNCGEEQLFIPNAFTPNDDGYNDKVCFRGPLLTEFHIAIFNRWGQMVYESDEIGSCWDGTFRNEKCLAGVYTYSCHIRCRGGLESDIKGDITLIR